MEKEQSGLFAAGTLMGSFDVNGYATLNGDVNATVDRVLVSHRASKTSREEDGLSKSRVTSCSYVMVDAWLE